MGEAGVDWSGEDEDEEEEGRDGPRRAWWRRGAGRVAWRSPSSAAAPSGRRRGWGRGGGGPRRGRGSLARRWRRTARAPARTATTAPTTSSPTLAAGEVLLPRPSRGCRREHARWTIAASVSGLRRKKDGWIDSRGRGLDGLD